MVKVISGEFAMAEPAPVMSRGGLLRNPLMFRRKDAEESEIPSERFETRTAPDTVISAVQ